MTVRGHIDRPVSFEVLGGQPAVAKHYRRGGAAEAAELLEGLWESPFGADRRPPGAPRLLGWDRGTIWMERIDGAALGRRGDLGSTEAATTAVATLLADLHHCGVEVGRCRSNRSIVRSCRRKAAEIPADTRVAFQAAVELVDAAATSDGPMVLSHGDFSPRNVLRTPAGVRLIDVDRVQMASPARDVAYWGAWAWATLLLAGTRPTWMIGDEFATAYVASADPSIGAAINHQELGFHRAAGLLRIAHGWSALAGRPEVVRAILAEVTEVLRPMTNSGSSSVTS